MAAADSATPVPDDRPYVLEELDDERMLARFGMWVDHPRLGFAEELKNALRTHERLACDLRQTKTLVSGWIRVLADLSAEARDTGKTVGIVGMDATVQSTADIIRCLHDLSLFDSIDEVWSA